ncbi:MAG: AAA family ATPase, partial [Candidatus Subteraquimicrobiales bacterium]|nr:AAA family ATPase [Candidatus Subteraquimicrobiales bacterium]
FGYPGLNAHNLAIKSEFDAGKVLKGNTNVYYEHDADNLLPESYNGLGFKNLIYIILQFISYAEKYNSKTPQPDFHLLFIEEPEVHLHPQMQCAFIKNIKKFIRSRKGWNVQVVITTHSSHIISESDFNTIRYFDSSKQYVEEKDLKNFKPKGPDTLSFLKQYLTLKKCDLFFADKVIMVEGTVERLLLPLMIKKLDEEKNTTLDSQYITLVEAGGAYVHKFKELLNFIGVKTLVITDLDSIKTTDSRKAVPVKDGDETSNAALKNWLPGKTKIQQLLKCDEKSKIRDNIRVAFQIPESDSVPCGRSFEEAFILTNAAVMPDNDKITYANLFKGKTQTDIQNDSY